MAVRLGGAIVAAVEEDAEQERVQAEKEAFIDNIANLFNVNLTESVLKDQQKKSAFFYSKLNSTLIDSIVGRGKYHKQKKLIKYIYPLVMGILLAKTVLIPLMLKLLTAVSTSSFVMSKISLAASALLFLKWIIGGNKEHEAKERVEIIHVPVVKDTSGSENVPWADNTWSGSNLYEKKTNKYRQNYIPFNGGKDVSFTTAATYLRYPQHNYNQVNPYDRPYPFLPFFV